MNTYTSGPQGSAVPLTREQRLERAVREIREVLDLWGDGDRATLLRRVLDRHGV